jgi:lipopolysaccharide biosynthesis protein
MASFAEIMYFVLKRGWYGYIQPQIGLIGSIGRNPDQLIGPPPPADLPLGPKIAVFVHFDPLGALRDHVLAYVTALHRAGYAIAFVTNSGRLRPEARAALEPLCAAILVRRNIGYDFGAMREGILRLGLPRPDTEQVLIANDSVYGPLRPLEETLARIDFSVADVWGCTESWQRRYHLQSYFLAFGPRALRHPAWLNFWNSVRPVQSKDWIIRTYEVGLTQQFLRAGLTCRAMWPYAELVKLVDPDWLAISDDEAAQGGDPIVLMRKYHARHIRDAAVLRRPLNPTSDLWRQLLLSGYPFLKRELLRSNPTNVNDVTDWRDVVRNEAGLDPTMIERDLQRALRNVAP